MSKKDFIALADAIRNFNNAMPESDRTHFTVAQMSAIADFCQMQNPAFKRDRWFNYIDGTCGKNGGKVRELQTA